MTKLSVVIIAHNEEGIIQHCLDSVKQIADEIIVVDSNSDDRTVEICRTNGCKVFHRAFDGYGTQKQFAVDQAINDWILSVDADEVLTKELQKEIIKIKTDPTGNAGFKIPFAYTIWERSSSMAGLDMNITSGFLTVTKANLHKSLCMRASRSTETSAV